MNKWLINKKPHEDHEDLNQKPGPSTSQNISKAECLDTNKQSKGKNKTKKTDK